MMVLNSSHQVENTPFTNLKELRDDAVVLLKLNTSHPLEDIAALRWNDVQVQDSTVTIHWRHPHGYACDEQLPDFVSVTLLRYLHTLHGAALATLEPDTPLWIGLRRTSNYIMLSTRSIAAIYRKHLDKTSGHVLQSYPASTLDNHIKSEQAPSPIKEITPHAQQPDAYNDTTNAVIREIAAAALQAALQAPGNNLAFIAPGDIAVLRQEITRRKATESKTATIRDLWQVTAGKRFSAACQVYRLLLEDASEPE